MQNTIKTFFLLGILTVLLVTLGGVFGGRGGITMAFMFSILMNGGMYFFADKLALSMSGAKPLSRQQAPEVYQVVEELASKMAMPMPKLYITPDMQANAFATGRGPGNASVAVTQGIMQTLNIDELRGVLAHELAHVKNRDILVATIASVIAGSISFIGNMAMFGGLGGSDEDRPNPMFGLLAMIVMPIAATLIQLAISRQREFGADHSGARTIGDGDPLARALIKIHNSASRFPMQANPATASLYIGNPLGGLGQGMTSLFSTHPSLEERIKRLEKI